MAIKQFTIEVTPTANLSANGTNTATGSMSWNVPAMPDGVTAWDYVAVSGSWAWTGKQSITNLTIDGETASNTFNIAITGTSPIVLTCVGGHKNATGNSFNWTNLKVVYTYSLYVIEKPVITILSQDKEKIGVADMSTVQFNSSEDLQYWEARALIYQNGDVSIVDMFKFTLDAIGSFRFPITTLDTLLKNGDSFHITAHSPNGVRFTDSKITSAGNTYMMNVYVGNSVGGNVLLGSVYQDKTTRELYISGSISDTDMIGNYDVSVKVSGYGITSTPSHGVGLLIESGTNLPANTTATVYAETSELTNGDGQYQINIWGQSTDGLWNGE